MSQVVVSSRSGGLQHEVQTGKHSFIADAGKDVGGAETGPDPHELLLASLGACTSMTLQLFAKRREWKLDHVNVVLTEETIEDPSNPGKKMSRINRDIEVKGDLNAEQVDTLKKIADKCPIHKLLTESKQIVTNLCDVGVESSGRVG
ncbi:MAG: OsmC family protein [Candidatus Obscuribacterales bacterium]|nr:OsmC family protein [Candidatus Obscuribacterales bacterium]